jgi:hypothetical protein
MDYWHDLLVVVIIGTTPFLSRILILFFKNHNLYLSQVTYEKV